MSSWKGWGVIMGSLSGEEKQMTRYLCISTSKVYSKHNKQLLQNNIKMCTT